MTTISINIDEDLRASIDSASALKGLDIQTAIHMFLTYFAQTGEIPSAPNEDIKKTAKLGGWEGKIWMSDDFNDPMKEFEEYY